MSQPTPPQRRRRWFSLSLRGLMLLILVLGGAMGWKARRASLQRRAVARIVELRGTVTYDWQPRIFSLLPAVSSEPHGPAWLRRMLGDEYFQDVVEVRLSTLSGLPMLPPPDASKDGPEWRAFEETRRRDKEDGDALFDDQLACLEGLDRIETLELEFEEDLKPEGSARLGRLSHLKELMIFMPLNAEVLVQIARLSELESLHAKFKLSDDSALALLERLPLLKTLRITDGSDMPPSRLLGPEKEGTDKITDAWLARLGRLQHLEDLTLSGGSEITDAGLAHLKGITQLRVLVLDQSPLITDVGLAHLKDLASLEFLDLHNSPLITDVGLAHLRGLASLESLNLGAATGITDAGITHLMGLKKLEDLHLSAALKLTDEGIARLAGIESLRWIELDSASEVTDQGVAHLAKLSDLQILHLNTRSLTEAGLNRLRSMTKLKSLTLTGAKIKGEIIDGIQAAIPGVRIRAERIADEAEAGTQPPNPDGILSPPARSPELTPPPAVPRN